MEKKAAVAVLKKARKTIIEEQWIKGAEAKNAAGNSVPATDPTATAFCALGALRKHSLPANWAELTGLLTRGCPSGFSVSGLNDAPKTKRADVLKMFDRAIASVK